MTIRQARQTKKELEQERQRDNEIRRMLLAQRKETLLGEIKDLRGNRAARLRRRTKSVFVMLSIITAVATASTAALSRAELHSNISSWHVLCGSVHDGDPTEAVRELASERRLVFERDENLSIRYDDDVYALKPEASWPDRLACAFRSVQARLYRVNQF